MRVGEMSEKSVQQAHLGDCRCNYWWQLGAFFTAFNDFYFSTLGLFTYTRCCADKPVWAGGGGDLEYSWISVMYICHNGLFQATKVMSPDRVGKRDAQLA